MGEIFLFPPQSMGWNYLLWTPAAIISTLLTDDLRLSISFPLPHLTVSRIIFVSVDLCSRKWSWQESLGLCLTVLQKICAQFLHRLSKLAWCQVIHVSLFQYCVKQYPNATYHSLVLVLIIFWGWLLDHGLTFNFLTISAHDTHIKGVNSPQFWIFVFCFNCHLFYAPS